MHNTVNNNNILLNELYSIRHVYHKPQNQRFMGELFFSIHY